MNSAFLTHLLREIEPDVVGLRVATISAPEPDVIVVAFARAERALVLDAGIDAPRVGWEAVRAAPRATRFAATAAARLAGACVARVAQPAGDRWAQFHFDNGLCLVWENFGRRANVVLVDGGVIVACVREYPPAPEITRAIRAGDPYPPPPDGAARNDAYAALGAEEGVREAGEQRANEAGAARADGHDAARPSAEGFASFAAAGAAWGAATRARAARLRLLVVLRAHWRERDRAARRALAAVDRDLAWASRFGEYRRSAEALVASFRLIERGASAAHVPDPAQPEATLVIPLDPAKSARENADRYFRDAKRAERGHAALETRRAMLASAAERAAAELARWDGAAGDAFLEGDDADRAKQAALREAAIAAGLVDDDDTRARGGARSGDANAGAARAPQTTIPGGFPLPPKPAPRKHDPLHGARVFRYEVAGGFTVLVGRTSADNDILTHKAAKPWDLWFHSGQTSGSHVILVKGSAKANPPKEALLEAAALAAHHSKARNAGMVPVIYTEKRYVRKPRKSPAGLASCEREKTLFVRPAALEEKRVARTEE